MKGKEKESNEEMKRKKERKTIRKNEERARGMKLGMEKNARKITRN